MGNIVFKKYNSFRNKSDNMVLSKVLMVYSFRNKCVNLVLSKVLMVYSFRNKSDNLVLSKVLRVYSFRNKSDKLVLAKVLMVYSFEPSIAIFAWRITWIILSSPLIDIKKKKTHSKIKPIQAGLFCLIQTGVGGPPLMSLPIFRLDFQIYKLYLYFYKSY